jgi:predicted dehydrogenase
MTPLTIGVVGCGNISPLYFRTMRHFPQLRPVAAADLDMALAARRAEEFGVEALPTDDLLHHPGVDLILNLTVPTAHAAIAAAALEAGKHVYNEKPLAATLPDAQALLAAATASGLRLGCAPSTFLGATVQTARRALDEGLIGEPVAAAATMLSRGMEHWHPNPAFFYQPGAGPMFDIGPYYLTALVTLLGPVSSVSSHARISFAEREITSEPLAGTRFPVSTPTHVAGTLAFETGPIATVVTSFDVWHSDAPRFEVYGSEGSLSLEAPNVFGGKVRVRGAKDGEWRELPLVHSYDTMESGWGLGLDDLASALREGRPHLASGEMAYHVLELMHAFLTSAAEERHVPIQSRCERPKPLAEPAPER